MKRYFIEESPFSYFFTADTRSAGLWFLVRLYLAWQWLQAGWEKLHDAAWVGASAGTALSGFVQGALAKTTGAHPDVQGWYASFLQTFVLPHAALFSHLVAWGEFLVGVALVIGFLTGLSAFFGIFMNLNYLLAGAVSVNPIMYTLGIGVVLAWRVAGYWGADRYVLPLLSKYLRPRLREG
ncbi:MAG TPA: DoxX family protein [Candidatus Paceibacterota bacterium]|nr:DoxX family protein [Candidatus Paceibacterota bacterium]